MPLPLIPLDLPPTVEMTAVEMPGVTVDAAADNWYGTAEGSVPVGAPEGESTIARTPLPLSLVSAAVNGPVQTSARFLVQADSTWVDAPPPGGEPGAVRSPESRAQVPSAPAIGSDPRLWPDPGIWMDGAVPSASVLSAQAETEGEVSPDGLSPLDQEAIRALILQADRQTYDPERQIVTASGDVLVQFGNSQLAADRLWVNLGNRHLRAEGNVFFNRNDQVIEGDTATYNLLQGAGAITNGRGELGLPTLGADLAGVFPNDLRVGTQPIDYRLQGEGSISQVTSPGGVSFGTDSTQVLFGGEESELRRLRFESETIFFDADGWYAENLRITNDPFSPPELEFRSNNVRLTPLNEEEDELVFDSPRFVFDDGLTIPVLRNRYILQRGQFPTDELNPLPTGIGIDGRDRGGVFVEREFELPVGGTWQVTVAPQFYLSRWLGSSDSNLFDPANFGVVARVDGSLGPRTSARGFVSLPGFDLENFTDQLRASFRTQQLIGTHRLNLEYSYRDRLFNGSLGFQDVQSSLGLLLESPLITLGDTQITLSYQVSGQYVTANTDRLDLLGPGETVDLTSLFRFQGSIDLNRGFLLWQGETPPSTPTQGLRFSPRPVTPFLVLIAGLRGVATYYTSNDLQESLEARVTLAGQIGRFERNFFDYTQFNIGFSTNFIAGDASPFLFDRVVDQKTISGGIVQQIYGPFLAGFQTAFNLDTGQEIDTNFILEYRRRAYGLLFRYSPTQETGFLGFRISNFDWTGRTAPFDAETSPGEVMVQ